MRIAILITTYKRAEMLLPLLQQINCQRANHELAVICVHDGPSSGYEGIEKYLKSNFGNTLYSTQDHFGKSHYYRVINVLYEIAKAEHEKRKFDYFIQIPDDIALADNFFEKAIRQFEIILDPKKVCLNLLNDGRNQPGWTRQPHKEVKFCHTLYILTQWVDMCFLSTSRFFELLNWKILRIDQLWASNPNLSSGVGLQISQRLFSDGNNIYQVNKTLVSHGDHESVMHPEHRRLNPLICKAEITSKEKVIVGMASLVGREGSLREAIDSLLPQVDEIHVTLNGYFEIPDFLKGNKKIHANIDATNKYGDAAKFRILGKSGYLFFTDDDLIYPADYVDRMVNYIENNKRAAIITVHGRRFESFPVKSYYHGNCFSIRCLALQPTDEFVHCPGTGVTAFHSSTIPVQLKDFEAANMADIWLGIAAQKHRVPIMAIRHNKGWIRESFEYDVKKSIHFNLHSRDAFQTKTVNSIKWTLHTLALNG